MKKLLFLFIIPVVAFAQQDSLRLDEKSSGKVGIKVEPSVDTKKPLYFVDGTQTKESVVNEINPDAIESITVLKGEKAIEKYGEEGKNGAIEIKMKKKEVSILEKLENRMPICGLVEGIEIPLIDSTIIYKNQFPGTVCQALVNNISEPKFIVDGEIVTNEFFKNISPNEISTIVILKEKEAMALFGTNGKNGVIVIKTKKYQELLDFKKEEYDLEVLDLGYESYLAMQPSAKTYSLSYLQTKNQQYVKVWNQRVISGNPIIYEMPIDYDSQIFYGLDFEYKLYQFFQFMEDKYSIRFI